MGEPIKSYSLLEWDTSISTELPKVWGPFDTEAERDSQICVACLENIHRRLVCLDFTQVISESGQPILVMYDWIPSEAYRNDLIRKLDEDDDGPYVSELKPENATRMWSEDRPPMEVRALQSLLRQKMSEEGDDG